MGAYDVIAMGSCRVTLAASALRNSMPVHGALVYYVDEIIQLIRYISCAAPFPPNLFPVLFHTYDPFLTESRRRVELHNAWLTAKHVLIEVSSLQRLVLPNGMFGTIRLLYDPKPFSTYEAAFGVRRERYTEQQFADAMDSLIKLCGHRDVVLVPHFQFYEPRPMEVGMDHAGSRVLIREWLKQAADRHGKRFWDQSSLLEEAPPSALYLDCHHYSVRGTAATSMALRKLVEP